MPLETGTFISDFVVSNPAHSDAVSQGDSHMRWIKTAILNSFTAITGAVTATHLQINSAVAAVVTGTAQAVHELGTAAAPAMAFLGNLNTGIYSPGANQVAIATNGTAALKVSATQSVEVVNGLTVDAGGAQITSGNVNVSAGSYQAGAKNGALLIPGVPVPWLSDTLPPAVYGNFGFLNGQAISRLGNPVLFSVWGTSFGAGDGSTTFNVPDLRDLTFIGKGNMGGTADRGTVTLSGIDTTGSVIGEGKHTQAVAELPNTAPTGSFNGTPQTLVSNESFWQATSSGIANPGSSATVPVLVGGNVNGPVHTPVTPTGSVTVGSINGNVTQQGMNVVQPSMVCNYITLFA